MKLILETERLLMRPLELSDADVMFKMDSNPNVHTYLWKIPVQTVEDSIKIIEYIHAQYQRSNIGRFATILKETGEFIGWTGIKYIDNHVENGNTNFFDYGYRLDEKFWGKGYATEASYAWLDYGFNDMKIEIMNAYAHHANGASNHILGKIGMSLIEDYPDKDGVIWNWWKMENPNK